MMYVLAQLDQRSVHVCKLFIFLFTSYNITGSHVNKIDSKLHCSVLVWLFENKMATTAVRHHPPPPPPPPHPETMGVLDSTC